MKRFLLLLTSILMIVSLSAQTNRKIKELQNKRGALQKEISKKESLLKTTKKDVGSQLNSLNTLSGQIEDRQRFIVGISNDVQVIERESMSLVDQLKMLQQDLLDKRKKYASSVQYLYKNKSIEEKLMFIFSANSLGQTYRRLRYVNEYATYQRLQGEEIIKKQQQIGRKKTELDYVKSAKQELLSEREKEKQRLEEQKQQKRALVSNLQKKQKGLQGEISKHRKEASKLNSQIDRLISIEIEKARKRAQEEARREAAAQEAARRRLAEKAEQAEKAERARIAERNERNQKSGKTTKKEKYVPVEKKEVKQAAAPSPVYSMDKADRQMSGSFERNRGSLPVPITGPYLITSHYGEYAVDGLKNVKLDNKGIDLQGHPGAQARAIFDGEVAVVFQVNGLVNIIIRHGSYISVYCNLSSASVSKGQKVSTRQSIGRIYSDSSDGNRTVLHFQLRKETSKLNPESWIGR